MDEKTRIATQAFTIRQVLVSHCNEQLTPDKIDGIIEKIKKEMTEGYSSWAFKD